MPPREETLVIVEHELEQARPWVEGKGLELDWTPEELRLRTVMSQPETDECFYLQALFDGYKELPPQWDFFDSDWAEEGVKGSFPSNSPSPFGSSIFHPHPFICAPFNRLAYTGYGGTHNNWNGPENWQNVEGKHVRAVTVGGMLQTIHLHLRFTRGRMA